MFQRVISRSRKSRRPLPHSRKGRSGGGGQTLHTARICAAHSSGTLGQRGIGATIDGARVWAWEGSRKGAAGHSRALDQFVEPCKLTEWPRSSRRRAGNCRRRRRHRNRPRSCRCLLCLPCAARSTIVPLPPTALAGQQLPSWSGCSVSSSCGCRRASQVSGLLCTGGCRP